MSAQSELMAPAALAALLRDYQAQGATGTLFLTTDANHWGCFGLEGGIIVTVRCRGAKGARALSHIAEAAGFTARFEASDVADAPPARPEFDPADVFLALAPTSGAADPGPPSDPVPAQPSMDASRQRSAQRIGTLIKTEAEAALGPMGPVLCDELFAARPAMHAEDIQYILGQLARHVGDADGGRAFQLQVLARLRGE